MDRVTLSLGLRMDWFNASLPSVHYSPSLLTPNRNFDVPAFQSVRQKDWTPKVGAAWDVFGDGKTALKVNFAKYVLGQSLVASNPLIDLSSNNVTTTGTRTWTDNDGDFIPDCDLTNPGAQSPTAAGGLRQVDTCGTVNPLFYTGLSTVNSLDPATGQFVGAGDDQARYGWQKRPYSWEFSLSAQREIGKGVSVNGGYFRRWFGNFLYTDNLSVQASDYDPYSITPSLIPAAPAVGRRRDLAERHHHERVLQPHGGGRGAGGEQLRGALGRSLSGQQRDRSLERVRHRHQRQAPARRHRPGRHEHRAADHRRLRHHASGQRRQVRPPVPAGGDHRRPVSADSCHVEQAWLTQLKFLGSFTVPKIEVQIGASYQNIPGIELAATYADLNSDIARPVAQGGLGRLPGSAISATATTNVSLLPQQTVYYDRLNQLDLRLGKILSYGRTRANVSLDLYNLFNKGTISARAPPIRRGWRRPPHLAAVDEALVDVRLLERRGRGGRQRAQLKRLQ